MAGFKLGIVSLGKAAGKVRKNDNNIGKVNKIDWKMAHNGKIRVCDRFCAAKICVLGESDVKFRCLVKEIESSTLH